MIDTLARRFDGGLLAGILVATMCLSACSALPLRPDLAAIYRGALTSPDRSPLILIPGLFGSKLRRVSTGEEIWPGNWWTVLFSDYRELALKDGPDTAVEAFDLAEQVVGIDYYKPLLETLTRYGGYVRTQPGSEPPLRGRALYVFPYDCWRRSKFDPPCRLNFDPGLGAGIG